MRKLKNNHIIKKSLIESMYTLIADVDDPELVLMAVLKSKILQASCFHTILFHITRARKEERRGCARKPPRVRLLPNPTLIQTC